MKIQASELGPDMNFVVQCLRPTSYFITITPSALGTSFNIGTGLFNILVTFDTGTCNQIVYFLNWNTAPAIQSSYLIDNIIIGHPTPFTAANSVTTFSRFCLEGAMSNSPMISLNSELCPGCGTYLSLQNGGKSSNYQSVLMDSIHPFMKNSFTIEFLARIISSGYTGMTPIVTRYLDSTYQWTIAVNASTSNPEIYVSTGGGLPYYSAFALDVPHYVAVTYNFANNQGALYCDNLANNFGFTWPTALDSQGELMIGPNSNFALTQAGILEIDMFSIYDRYLSLSEILVHRCTALPGQIGCSQVFSPSFQPPLSTPTPTPTPTPSPTPSPTPIPTPTPTPTPIPTPEPTPTPTLTPTPTVTPTPTPTPTLIPTPTPEPTPTLTPPPPQMPTPNPTPTPTQTLVPTIIPTPEPIPTFSPFPSSDVSQGAPVSSFEPSPALNTIPSSQPQVAQQTPSNQLPPAIPTPSPTCPPPARQNFTCINGVWVANSLNISTTVLIIPPGIYVVNGSVSVGNGSTLNVANSSLNISGSLTIGFSGVIVANGSALIIVSGNISFGQNSSTSLALGNQAPIQVAGCINFGGRLKVAVNASQTSQVLPVATYSCSNGAFESVQVTVLSNDCIKAQSGTDYRSDRLNLLLNFYDSCEVSGLPQSSSSIAIFLLIVMGVLAHGIRRD